MDRRMRILTVRRRWAEAIIFAGKDVENRVRNIAGEYRGPVAIHCARHIDTLVEWEGFRDDHPEAHKTLHQLAREGRPSSIGNIIGVVDLVDVHDGRAESLHSSDGAVIATQPCSVWAQADVHHLVFANPRPLAEPIPYTGALGLRDLAARDPETLLAITRQIGPTP